MSSFAEAKDWFRAFLRETKWLEVCNGKLRPRYLELFIELDIRWFAKDGIRCMAITEGNANNLVLLSKVDYEAFELSREIAASYIITNREMPEALRAETALDLLGKRKRPRQKPGTKDVGNFVRDIVIFIAMLEGSLRFGLKATQSNAPAPGSSPESCARMVAEVLGEHGIHLSPRAVQDVWVNRAKRREFAKSLLLRRSLANRLESLRAED